MESRKNDIHVCRTFRFRIPYAPPKEHLNAWALRCSFGASSAVRTLSAAAGQNVRGTMISPTPMRTATDIRRNECAVELRKKNPDRYCDPNSGAGNQSRTDDLVITNDVLYQLSHASKIVGFSVDPTIISNFSPFVNPFLKIFLGWGEEDLGGGGEDLGGREPPLERRGSLPPNLPHSPRTSPKCTRPCSEKI